MWYVGKAVTSWEYEQVLLENALKQAKSLVRKFGLGKGKQVTDKAKPDNKPKRPVGRPPGSTKRPRGRPRKTRAQVD